MKGPLCRKWSHCGYPYHTDLHFCSLEEFWYVLLEIFSCDIQNAYLNAESREKIWICAGPDFGSEAGTIMIDRMELYGFKSSGAEFRVRFAKFLDDIGLLSTNFDLGVCYRPTFKPNVFE